MVPEYVRGLPFHALIIHATVVLLPLTALALVLAAFSASVRSRMGAVLPLAGIVSLVLVPITTASGSRYKADLEAKGLKNPTLDRHAQLADQVLPWAIGLAVMTVVVYGLVLVGRRLARQAGDRSAPARTGGVAISGRSPISIVVAVLSVAVAVGLVATVVAVGHLGATAVYGDGAG